MRVLYIFDTFLVLLCGGPSQGDKVRVVQTLLFVQGINTLLQTLFGTRLPTVIGGSWAFMVPIISIIHDQSLAGITDPHAVSVYFDSFHFQNFLSLMMMILILPLFWIVEIPEYNESYTGCTNSGIKCADYFGL